MAIPESFPEIVTQLLEGGLTDKQLVSHMREQGIDDRTTTYALRIAITNVLRAAHTDIREISRLTQERLMKAFSEE